MSNVSTTGQDRESLCQPYWTTLVASRITYSNLLMLRGTHRCFTHSLKHILQITSTCIDEWHRSRRYCYCHRSYFKHEKNNLSLRKCMLNYSFCNVRLNSTLSSPLILKINWKKIVFCFVILSEKSIFFSEICVLKYTVYVSKVKIFSIIFIIKIMNLRWK